MSPPIVDQSPWFGGKRLVVRRYTSSLSLVFFVSLLSSSSFSSRVLANLRSCARHTHGAGLSAVNTPVVYTNDLSRHTRAHGEKSRWRRTSSVEARQRETHTNETERPPGGEPIARMVVTRRQAGATRWGPSKFQKRTRAPFATRIKGSNRDSFGQCRYDRRTRSSVHVRKKRESKSARSRKREEEKAKK